MTKWNAPAKTVFFVILREIERNHTEAGKDFIRYFSAIISKEGNAGKRDTGE